MYRNVNVDRDMLYTNSVIRNIYVILLYKFIDERVDRINILDYRKRKLKLDHLQIHQYDHWGEMN